MSKRHYSATGILLAGLAATALTAFSAQADCVRASRFGTLAPQAAAHGVRELPGDASVSAMDPALDSEFNRFADLHRDAVGYTVAEVPANAMVARASPEFRHAITR